MKVLLPLAAVLMIGGCVSMGTNYRPEAVQQLKPGMTKAEVIALLGKPNTVTSGPKGTAFLGWVHSTGSMFGADARSISLQFDAENKLIDTGYQNNVQIH